MSAINPNTLAGKSRLYVATYGILSRFAPHELAFPTELSVVERGLHKLE